MAPEFKANGGFEPEAYMEYSEGSNPPPNAEIGCQMPFLDGHRLEVVSKPSLGFKTKAGRGVQSEEYI
jgi:hypothetical protein